MAFDAKKVIEMQRERYLDLHHIIPDAEGVFYKDFGPDETFGSRSYEADGYHDLVVSNDVFSVLSSVDIEHIERHTKDGVRFVTVVVVWFKGGDDGV